MQGCHVAHGTAPEVNCHQAEQDDWTEMGDAEFDPSCRHLKQAAEALLSQQGPHLSVLHKTAGSTPALIRVTYLGKVPTTGMQFLSGCTEKPVIELWKKHTLAREDVFPANALLEIRPFQVWLHHLDHKGEATVHMDTFQVARIAYCTADHNVSPNIFAWVYREINDDLSYQMDCHAVECESKLEAKKLAHAMMEAFKKTFHSMKSDGRIHRNSSSEEASQELESDDG
ncbi:PTB-containing, cubilin and LRP1-interacting protein [Camelus ferus]|nr:PTB-containing, cubilin and LRP1-interacting protein [Camelus ferus]